jgi:soluble lytic murein transglycosylase-like protein
VRAALVATAVSLAGAVVAGLWYYFYVRSYTTLQLQSGGGSADSTVGDIVTAVESSVVGWKNVGSAADWLPTIAQAEQQHGLPTDLLARMAYQESHFREEIIRGTKASPAGALGILQLMPQYFRSVNTPTPFTDADVRNQIDEAAQQMQSLYSQFSDWSLALAAYNAGAGNVRKYNGIPPFTETQNYVAQITADVPSLGAA